MFSYLYLRVLPFLFNPIKYSPRLSLLNVKFSWFLMVSREVVSSSFSCLFSQKSRFWGSCFSFWGPAEDGTSSFTFSFVGTCCSFTGSGILILAPFPTYFKSVGVFWYRMCSQPLPRSREPPASSGWKRLGVQGGLCWVLPSQRTLGCESVNTGLYLCDLQHRMGPSSDSSKLLEQGFKKPVLFISLLCFRRSDKGT